MKRRSQILAVLGVVSILLTGCSMGSCSSENIEGIVKEAIEDAVDDVKDKVEYAVEDAQEKTGIIIFGVPGLSEKKLKMYYTETHKLRFDKLKKDAKISWYSSDKSVVKIIDKNEKKTRVTLLAMKPGKAEIVAEVQREGKPVKTYECKVTVDDSPIEEGLRYNLKKNGYCFRNTWTGFGYPSDYSIPYSRYQEVFDDMCPKELFEGSEWGGNCYGMSVSSVYLFNNPKRLGEYIKHGNINTYGYTRIVKAVYDGGYSFRIFYLDPKSKLGGLIERYQIAQDGAEIDDIEDDIAKPFEESASSRAAKFKEIVDDMEVMPLPYLVAVSWYDEEEKDIVGHEMVIDGRKPKHKGGSWYRIYLYDPNYPYVKNGEDRNLKTYWEATERYIDVNTSDGRWRMQVNKQKIGDSQGGKYRDQCDVFIYDAKKLPDLSKTKLHFYQSAVDDSSSVLQYSGKDFSVLDSEGNTVYAVKNGMIKTRDRSVVTVIPDIGAGDGTSGEYMKIHISDTGCTVKSNGNGRFILSSKDSIYSVDAEAGMKISDKGDGTLGLKANRRIPDVHVLISRDGEESDTCVSTDIDIEKKESTVQVAQDGFVADTPSKQHLDLDVQTQSSGVHTWNGIKTGVNVNLATAVKEIKGIRMKKAGKMKLILTWKPDKGAKGYEIQYATAKNLVGAKTVTASSSRAALKKNRKKTYYIRIRGFRTPSGTKEYGPWSKIIKSAH